MKLVSVHQKIISIFLLFFIFQFIFSCTNDEIPTCVDGIRNGSEIGVDCGGPCRPCSCFNGVKDENEDCIDCGGDCFPCNKITGRFADPVFQTYSRYSNLSYGTGITEPYGTERDLSLAFYEADKDTLLERPLIIMVGQTTYADKADGGFFTDGINYIEDFVSKGYVVANIIGIRNWEDRLPMSVDVYDRTAMRVRSDIRAAVRYFKKFADLYKVDTANIWLMGASGGAMASLHAAYIDESDLNEIDPDLSTYIMKDGGIDGNSGNKEFSSSVKGVISLSGMMFDVKIIDFGEPLLCSIIGGDDQYRPFGCESIKVNWIEEARFFCGPSAMQERMEEVGFDKDDYYFRLTDVPPADHYAPFDPAQCPECADEITDFIANRLGYCE